MWDQRYSEKGFAYGIEPNDFLVESAEFIPPRARILCLAEGEGRNSVFLAEKGYDVVAVDSSAVAMEKAANLASSRTVTLQTVVADLSTYIIAPLSYDVIVSIFCHLPPKVRAGIHAQIYSGLRPGGVFLLEGFSRRQLMNDTGGPKNPELLMDLESVKAELLPLKLKHAVEVEREIHEGKYHNGSSTVIQIIGTKQ